MVTRVCEVEKNNEIQDKIREVRMERYVAQSVAKKALPNERVSMCLRRTLGNNVEVWKHLKTEKAFFNGLLVCGSVWTCPVCAAKISERRKAELQKAFTTHQKNGGHLALLTLTFSHKKTDKLETTLKKFSEATSKLMSGSAYQKIREEMKMIGRVKVYEVTHGNNGFHPHAHIAIFYENEVCLDKMSSRMYKLWSNACKKVGLTASKKHGLDLQSSEHASAYLAKHGNWSMEQELSKSHIKKGKEGSLTPFDFLREYLKTDDEGYLRLFREYVACFKGKKQVHWSKGLKMHFNILDKTDEEVAKEKVEQADRLGMLTSDQWKKVLYPLDLRAQLLNNIEKFGFDIGLTVTIP